MQTTAHDYSTHESAGFWIRAVASILDAAIFFFLKIMLSSILKIGMHFSFHKQSFIGSFCLGLILSFFYYCYPVMKWGKTPGKLLCNLRIVNKDYSTQISFGQILGREWIGKILSGLFLFIGYFMAAFGEKRALHDYMFGTRVIKE